MGSEFGPDLAGKTYLVVRALYGVQSAGASFRNHMAGCMINIGYSSCLENTDLGFKEETRASDGAKYYAYLFLYVDDCLVIHHASDIALHELDCFFKMESGSIWDTNMDLGAKIRNIVLENGREVWANNAPKYVQEAVSNSEAYLHDHFGGRNFANNVMNSI